MGKEIGTRKTLQRQSSSKGLLTISRVRRDQAVEEMLLSYFFTRSLAYSSSSSQDS